MDRERDLLGIEDLKYDEAGLIPAVVQDDVTGDVLMVAYMNAESLAKTIETGKTWFWSRSRQTYWMKGESSGHVQDVHELRYDCDADCLLVRVTQHGPGACHTNERSCFYRRLYPEPQSLSGTDAHSASFAAAEGSTTRLGAVLDELYALLESRKAELPEGSYTAKLLSGPLDSLLKKIAEESGEVIMAAKDADRGAVSGDPESTAADDLAHLRYEIADLVYHLLVVMVREGLTPADLATELEGRRKG